MRFRILIALLCAAPLAPAAALEPEEYVRPAVRVEIPFGGSPRDRDATRFSLKLDAAPRLAGAGAPALLEWRIGGARQDVMLYGMPLAATPWARSADGGGAAPGNRRSRVGKVIAVSGVATLVVAGAAVLAVEAFQGLGEVFGDFGDALGQSFGESMDPYGPGEESSDGDGDDPGNGDGGGEAGCEGGIEVVGACVGGGG